MYIVGSIVSPRGEGSSGSAHMAVRLIALSRVLLAKDVAVLSTVADSHPGTDLLNQLLVITLRLTVVAGVIAGSPGLCGAR